MAADSTYEIGMLANADAYVSDTVDGTGHLKVTVSPNCVQVDYIKAFLPADTIDGINHNREVAFSYTIGNCETSGISENVKQNDWKVYPNPANDFINIYSGKDILAPRVTLLNYLGEFILTSNSQLIDISKLSNGIYLVKIETHAETTFNKLIVNH
jgi:hypothetical protein